MESPKSSRSSSPAEERHFIDSWKPEPLVPEIQEREKYDYVLKPHVISSKPGKYIRVDGKECLNAGTHNYLDMADLPTLEEASIEMVKKYGVGSCGPRAFYGTMDVHLQLEEELAKFLNVEEVVVYSYGFSTIASAIPAYAKSSDVIFYDDQCNFAIQRGILAARSRAIKFKHNDCANLREKIVSIQKEFTGKNGEPRAVRTFLILEGIYAKTGDMCRLNEFVELAKEYKIRVFIDESRSFGVLGSQGKGITQHLNVNVDDLDLIMVSLENALCSYGGFCAGTHFIIDHQRLAGSGYCFSASLPPFQCQAALESLRFIDNNPLRIKRAQELFTYAHEKLTNLTHLRNLSHPLSPIKILVLKSALDGVCDIDTNLDISNIDYVKEDERRLERICDDLLRKEQIVISVARYLEDEELNSPIASIRLIVNAGMRHIDVDRIFDALQRFSTK